MAEGPRNYAEISNIVNVEERTTKTAVGLQAFGPNPSSVLRSNPGGLRGLEIGWPPVHRVLRWCGLRWFVLVGIPENAGIESMSTCRLEVSSKLPS